jgi:nitroimidazol reductase NimA-like FMN-containing flavoprotein (pyridoxamine 5'-phosphate oxidase superfamily)
MAQRVLEEIPVHEGWNLLRAERVGHVIYHDESGPIAVPLNYAVLRDSIAFRVAGGTKRHAISQPRLGFEVDHIDGDARSGWSVIVLGTGRESASRRRPTWSRTCSRHRRYRGSTASTTSGC